MFLYYLYEVKTKRVAGNQTRVLWLHWPLTSDLWATNEQSPTLFVYCISEMNASVACLAASQNLSEANWKIIKKKSCWVVSQPHIITPSHPPSLSFLCYSSHTCYRSCTWHFNTWQFCVFLLCQLSVLLPEGKRTLKRQLYSKSFTLREAASSIFEH